MVDDEGVVYWEVIYGQLIYIYFNFEYVNFVIGYLEKMIDEEYVEYVCQKMWEKIYVGLLEEWEKCKK